MNPMAMLMNCGGELLLNMGAVGALAIRDGENPEVEVHWVMGGDVTYNGKAARLIIDELRRQLPEPVDPGSAAAKAALLRGF